jgi:hypothetical protein
MLVVANVSPRPKTRFKLEKAISTCCLTSGSLLAGLAGYRQDPQPGQLLLETLAAVGEIRQELAGYSSSPNFASSKSSFVGCISVVLAAVSS